MKLEPQHSSLSSASMRLRGGIAEERGRAGKEAIEAAKAILTEKQVKNIHNLTVNVCENAIAWPESFTALRLRRSAVVSCIRSYWIGHTFGRLSWHMQ